MGRQKYNVKEKLTEQGYRVHEANVGAFSSNYDRAVELYYYIKGGRVDYGAAHANMVTIVMEELTKVLFLIGNPARKFISLAIVWVDRRFV